MRYRTIVVDPPWQTMAGPLRGREGFVDAYEGGTRPLAYPSLTVEQIAALPVGSLAAPDAALFLWTTNGYLPHSFGVINAWGFKYSTALVWAKKPMGSGLGGAFGISTEFAIYARRGRVKHRRRTTGTWFEWKRPYDERGKPRHSGKPPAFQDVVETVFDGPYLEMFARTQRLGWDSWGDQALNHVEIPPAVAGNSRSAAGNYQSAADRIAADLRRARKYCGTGDINLRCCIVCDLIRTISETDINALDHAPTSTPTGPPTP